MEAQVACRAPVKPNGESNDLRPSLEEVPEELVVHFVVVLHFRRFYKRAKRPWATVGGSAFQIGIAALHVRAEQLGGPVGFLEIINRGVDVVRQIPFGLTQVLY